MDWINNIFVIICTQIIICNGTIKCSDSVNSFTLYRGESFPIRYLVPEDTVCSTLELEYFIKRLNLTVNYFYKEMLNYNATDINRALGIFFMKVVLKRVIHDYRHKLTNGQHTVLKDVISKGDHIVSHYVYMVKQSFDYENGELENRVARVIRDDSSQVYSLGDFNSGRLKKWILSNISMHSYIEQMDDMTLSRENYAHITEHIDSFFISVGQSDECLSHVVYNPEPIHLSELQPCMPDPFCRKALLSSPSAAYALSHRLLNLLMLRHSRRCYIQTDKEDSDLMDILCAFMFREAVYLARRGYFARDLFLEHGIIIIHNNPGVLCVTVCIFITVLFVLFHIVVALCSLLGYEEFFRLRWFRKAASWMDDEGCISESPNFLMNRSRLQVEREKDIKTINRLRKRLWWSLLEECHSHPMALLVIVLAHAVRYILEYGTQ